MKYIRQPQPLIATPKTIAAFDSLVAVVRSRRTTFTEEEVLQPIWEQGEDARLREDIRFWQLDCGHWHLAEHRLVNDELIARLRDGRWDGHGVEVALGILDTELGKWHVYCPVDARLKQDELGTWHLANTETISALSDDAKADLDQFVPRLYEAWRATGESPWHTQRVVEILYAFGWQSTDDSDATGLIITWLLTCPDDWSRVARDLWIPRVALPAAPQTVIYAVPTPKKSVAEPPPSFEGEVTQPQIKQPAPDQHELQADLPRFPAQQDAQGDITWRMALRTTHLNSGYIPIPPEARSLYPECRGLASVAALRGVWHEDGDHFDLWLDRGSDRLFGDRLVEKIGLLEAGSILRLRWNSSNVLFSVDGIDEEVNQEESRLSDPDALANLRRGLGESYRQSLRAILGEHSEGLSLPELHRQLSARQGHIVHRGSLRSVLQLCTEFYRDGQYWKLSSTVNGADELRRAVVAQQLTGTTELPTLIRVSRERIDSLLRKLSGKD